MLITGCGAGLLNGETAKVSMSVIPPERGGMASGISGTLRFVGLVTGITGLGVVLASQTERYFVGGTRLCPYREATRIRLSPGLSLATFRAWSRKRPSLCERRLQNWRASVSLRGSPWFCWPQA